MLGQVEALAVWRKSRTPGTGLSGKGGILPSLLHSLKMSEEQLPLAGQWGRGGGRSSSTCGGGGQVHAPVRGLQTGVAEVCRAAVDAERVKLRERRVHRDVEEPGESSVCRTESWVSGTQLQTLVSAGECDRLCPLT